MHRKFTLVLQTVPKRKKFEGVKIVPLDFFRQPRHRFGFSHAYDFLIQSRLPLLNFHLLNLVERMRMEMEKNSLQTKASLDSIRSPSDFFTS